MLRMLKQVKYLWAWGELRESDGERLASKQVNAGRSVHKHTHLTVRSRDAEPDDE